MKISPLQQRAHYRPREAIKAVFQMSERDGKKRKNCEEMRALGAL